MIIAVASGKGGTGKTLVSTALALSAGDCTYIDLDVEEPNGFVFLKPAIEKEIPYSLLVPEINEAACTFCEKCAAACMFNALTVLPSLKKTMFFPDLCHSCGSCSYVCNVPGALKEVKKEIGIIRTGKSGPVTFIEGRLHVGRPSGVPLISGIIDQYIEPGSGPDQKIPAAVYEQEFDDWTPESMGCAEYGKPADPGIVPVQPRFGSDPNTPPVVFHDTLYPVVG